MFKKYRMYCYIRRKGKVDRDYLIRHFKVSDQYLSDLTGANNTDGELACYGGMVELRAEGYEYISRIDREVWIPFWIAVIGAFLGAILGTLAGYGLGLLRR